MILALVGVQLDRPAPRATAPAGAHARHCVEGARQHVAVVAVGSRKGQAERRAVGVRDEVALCTRLTPARWVRARRSAPFSQIQDNTGLRSPCETRS